MFRTLWIFVLLASVRDAVVFGEEIHTFRGAFDDQMYNDVIDIELCEEQLQFLNNHTLGLHFLDASARIPSGILTGNVNDLGNYHECLAIDQNVLNYEFKGKYCTILVPLEQDPSFMFPTLPDIPWITPEPENMDARLEQALELKRDIQTMAGVGGVGEMGEPQLRIPPVMTVATAGLTLAFCIPKVCPTRQAVEFVQRNFLFVNFTFHEYYCRLPGDKPWAPADIVAITLFSIIGFFVLLSTMYDLNHVFVLERDPKEASTLLSCFSLYTNTRRVLTFNESADTLDCIDGIRSVSMLWVVVGHTFVLTNLAYVQNLFEATEWITQFENVWVTAAPITVDTFFMLSGILGVYTTIGKITRRRFVFSLHLFYLNRWLRMFPLLATVVLLQASLFNHVADGPFWENVALATERCRKHWWSALLHVQNYVNPEEICIAQTWYISVDMQLMWVSPLVLIWMFGAQQWAWIALGVATTLALISSSVYSFLFDFPAAIVNLGRLDEFNEYMTRYYINTLTRAPPFFVGMIYGYLLHLYRGRKFRMRQVHVAFLWLMAFGLMAFAIFTTYPVMQPDHNNQTLDNFLNAYMRALWALALGWLIFACVKGYGGPINWFLSLRMWKLPARLSYGMYLVHFQLMLIVNGTWTQTKYFTTGDGIYRFFSDLMLTFLVAFLLGLVIDAPFSTLQKVLVNGGGKKKKPAPPPLATETSLPRGSRGGGEPIHITEDFEKSAIKAEHNGTIVLVPETSEL